MRAALACLTCLAACVPAGQPVPPGETVVIDGRALSVRQERDWPVMIAPVSAETGETVIVASGRADTVIVSGTPDSRSRAIRALAAFCAERIDPQGFDTQFVYRDPATGDWWFDQWRCR